MEQHYTGDKGDTAKPAQYHNINAPQDNPPRARLLQKASGLITGDRNNQYGPPTQDFKRTADALNALGYRGPDGRELVAHDTAVIMMVLKLSRIMWQPEKEDSWTDLAGYAGCGWECVTDE